MNQPVQAAEPTKVRRTYTFNPRELRQFEKKAERQGVSTSWLLREIMAMYLKGRPR